MRQSNQRHTYDYFIDEHGSWFCEGNPVTDPQLFRLLSRSLFRQDEHYFLRCEGEVHPVRVADAPLWIRYVHVETDSHGSVASIHIELHDGRREPLHPETLRIAGNNALYCLATSRRLKARFGKIAYYEITRHLQMDDADQFYFIIGGERYSPHPEK